MRRKESLVLPEDIRNRFGSAISSLGVPAMIIAREAGVSGSLVSHLVTGKKGVKDIHCVGAVCASLEHHAENRFGEGLIAEEQFHKLSSVIKDVRGLYGLADPKELGSVELIKGSILEAIRKSISIAQAAADGLAHSPTEQILAALRTSQAFNETAQAILRADGDRIFPH